MKKISRKILTVFMVAAVLLGIAVPAFADDVASIEYSSVVAGEKETELSKVFLISNEMDIPAAQFNYAVSAGSKVNGDAEHLDVLAGVDPDKVKIGGKTTYQGCSIVYAQATKPGTFTDGDTITDSTNGDITLRKDASDTEHYMAVKTKTIDFSGCSFTKPGVYRYIITESGDNPGVVNDTNLTRTVDVYVENRLAKNDLGELLDGKNYLAYVLPENNTAYFLKNNEYYAANADDTLAASPTALTEAKKATLKPQLKVAGFVMYVGTVTTAPSSVVGTAGVDQTMEDGTTTKTTNGYEALTSGGDEIKKSIGFKNEYQAYTLTLKKEASGNQADLSEFFKFTVNIEGVAGRTYSVDLSNALASVPAAKIEGATEAHTNADNITAYSDGKASAVYYLQAGQSIIIKDILGGTSFVISEDSTTLEKEGYRAEISVSGDTNCRYKATTSGSKYQYEDKKTDNSNNTDGLTANTVVTFTNIKEGLVPTGVIMKVIPVVAAGLVVVVVLIILIVRGKKRNDEEEDEE